MEDSRLNAMECLKTDYIPKRSTELQEYNTANVDLTESLLDNWLKNNHNTVDKIYYLRSLFVFFLRILVFKFISQPQKTGTKTESCGKKLDLSE